MLNSVIETFNPKGGHGLAETIIVILLIIAVVVLNVLEIPVSTMLEYIVIAVVSYIFGSNHKNKWDGRDRRVAQDDFNGRKDIGGEDDE